MIMAGDRLFRDMILKSGPSVFVRQLARLARPAFMLPVMEAWLKETTGDGKFYHSPGPIEDGRGFGLCHASRGVLGHWVEIKEGIIQHYQVITPTAWNASPRDTQHVRGPMEEALIGTPVQDTDNPIDVFHVVRSFDPCLVCMVHTLDGRSTTVRAC
jgi:hydrogenase large subunit